jgi:transcription initiation factor TFIIIB Brf1 subunit/transcription initiation factor TFIIB
VPLDEDNASDTEDEVEVEIESIEALLKEVSLEDKIGKARKWCAAKGAETLEDLREEDYAEQFVKALELPDIKGKKLLKAIKSIS